MTERDQLLVDAQVKLKEARELTMSAANMMYKANEDYGDVDLKPHNAIMASAAANDVAQKNIADLLIGDNIIPPA